MRACAINLGGYLMKTQMRFQKYICLAVLITSVLALAYAFCYMSGGLNELSYVIDSKNNSIFKAGDGYNDATLYLDIQGFNDTLMYCGIVMIVLSVLLYITACNSRRNYYITNYVATGVCAGGNIVMSLVLMIMNGMWLGEYLNIDFEAWEKHNNEIKEFYELIGEKVPKDAIYSSDPSIGWFVVGFIVYFLVIVACVLLILNLVWKIKLMQGEKKLLNGANTVEGGEAV